MECVFSLLGSGSIQEPMSHGSIATNRLPWRARFDCMEHIRSAKPFVPPPGCECLGDILLECRVLRDGLPPTPPGPEGSNGNGSFRAQKATRCTKALHPRALPHN